MAKANQRIIVINMKGSDSAISGTEEMVDSVVEALRSQFPKLKLETTTLAEPGIQPVLMFPTKLTSEKKG